MTGIIRKQKLKLRAIPKFLASIFAGTGTSVRKDGLATYVDLDYEDLGVITSYSDVLEATTYLASWESTGDDFSKISITDFKADLTASFGLLYQPLDADLTAIAGLTSAANKLPYFTGSATAALADFTAFARTLVDDADNTAARATLGVVIGTDVQAFDSDLAAVAALASTGIARRTGAGTWSVGTAVSNAELATMAAYTLKGNATGSSAVPTDISIPALTQKVTPVAADKIMIADSAASDALKYTLFSAFGGGGSSPATTTALGTVLFPQNFLSGLGLANNGSDATNDIDITIGVAADSTNVAMMSLASALTKQLDAAWAVGTNAGGRMSAAAIANTTYHVWLIQRSDTGVVDVGFDVSPSAPTMPTNYDRKRRIGSIIRAGGVILPFTQFGNHFYLTTYGRDINTQNVGTTATTYTLASVPTGIVVHAVGVGFCFATGATSFANFYPLIVTDQTVAYGTFANVRDTSAGTGGCAPLTILTNASAQIRARGASAGATIDFLTHGWIDTRGQ